MWTSRRQPLGRGVRRPALVDRLADPMAPPLAVLVAPAGYGKTTLLSEWATCDGRPFAWVTVDERDNDGDRLRHSVARAAHAAVGDDPKAAFVLVIDDAHALYRRSALDALRGRGETKAGAMRGRLFTEVGGTNGDVQIRTHPRGAGFAAG